MTVRKFRSVEDMPDEVWREPGSPELLDAIRRTWAFAAETCRKRFPPGVFKHRSLEEMQELQDEWAQANFREHRSRLSGR